MKNWNRSIKKLETQFNKLLEERNRASLSETQLAQIQKRSTKAAGNLEMSEAETRELIDAQLVKAGWIADTQNINYKTKKTLPQKGKSIAIAEWPTGSK